MDLVEIEWDARHDGDRRGLTRDQISVKSEIRCLRLSIPCVVDNISATGARILVDSDAVVSSPLILGIPGIGDFRGELAWRDQYAAGIRFLEDPEKVLKRISS